MTQVFLQDAVVKDLEQLFADFRLRNSLCVDRSVRVFLQNTPYREGEDVVDDLEAEETDPEKVDPPEPYIVVRLTSGELPEADKRQTAEIVLIICVCDPDPNRQGYRDALHITNVIMTHYGENSVVGKKFQIQFPIRWATGEEDNHPYYFVAMALNFDAPAIYKEVPET